MRRLSLALALMSLLALPAQAANFSAKDAAAATIIFTNPGNCTTGCTPIFSWADSTGTNLVAVLTAGADAASNTANGGIVYNRNMVFNGTTWDRWQGAISIASGKVASGAFASGSIASGAVASGAVASGAYASGSIASGAMVDLGAQADAAAVADNSTASLIALLKRTNQNLTTVNTSLGSLATHSDAIAATPACSAAPCATTIGNVGIDPISGKATPAFVNLALPATTTTQIIALSGSTKTYITSLKMMASGAVNLTLKYGTGSNCGTGTTTLEGPYPLAAQAGVAIGSGSGAVIIVPAGQATCVTTDASVSGFVSMTSQQF